MTVLILEKVPPGLRGELTRWMLEVRAGIFIGTVSPRVRERLWSRACGRKRAGNALLIFSARNEQGFVIESLGDNAYSVFDIDGLQLIRRT